MSSFVINIGNIWYGMGCLLLLLCWMQYVRPSLFLEKSFFKRPVTCDFFSRGHTVETTWKEFQPIFKTETGSFNLWHWNKFTGVVKCRRNRLQILSFFFFGKDSSGLKFLFWWNCQQIGLYMLSYNYNQRSRVVFCCDLNGFYSTCNDPHLAVYVLNNHCLAPPREK